MRIRLIILSGLCLFFSCKRELSAEERAMQAQDSIKAFYLNFGMNADSTFSITKYQKDWKDHLEDIQETTGEVVEENPIFDDYTLIFNANDEIFYYENPLKGYWLCGTASLELYHHKMIAELHEVQKQDIKKIDADTLIGFIKKINFKKKSDNDSYSSLVLAIGPDQLNSKPFLRLREYMYENLNKYTIRPISTRERLVTEALIKNTSEDFSALNWDSIYQADFKRFYPYE